MPLIFLIFTEFGRLFKPLFPNSALNIRCVYSCRVEQGESGRRAGRGRLSEVRSPAVLSELAEWLINGKECLGVQMQPSHARCTDPSSEMQSKPGTLVRSAPRMLAEQQTGLQAVDSGTPARGARPSRRVGTAPRAQQHSVPAHAWPRCWLSGLGRAAPVLGPEPRCCASRAPLFAKTARVSRGLPGVSLHGRPGRRAWRSSGRRTAVEAEVSPRG